MIFELQGQFIEERICASAEAGSGGGLIVRIGPEAHRARALGRAIRIACAAIGPLMERGDRAGGGWGLMVLAGPASVAYGNWPAGPPGEPGPELAELRRILNLYRPRDGARAALHNATKVIEAYAPGRQRGLRRAA